MRSLGSAVLVVRGEDKGENDFSLVSEYLEAGHYYGIPGKREYSLASIDRWITHGRPCPKTDVGDLQEELRKYQHRYVEEPGVFYGPYSGREARMRIHDRWVQGFWLGILLMGITNFGWAATDTITLGNELFFINANGEKVKLPPGTYQVTQGKDDAEDVLLFESSVGVFQIQGELLEHEGELEVSMAMSLPQSDDEQVVMLLLPNGTGVEAWGSQNPVQTRGSLLTRTRRTGVRKALQTVRPSKRKKVSRKERPQKASAPGEVLKAVKGPSEELQGLQKEQSSTSSASDQSPTVGELLKTFSQLPGGKERLQEAKTQGVSISSTLSQKVPLKGIDYVTFRLVRVTKDRSIVLEGQGKRNVGRNSRAYYWVTAPSTGWYLVNFQVRTSRRFQAELRHIGPGWLAQLLFNTPPVQRWGNPQTDKEVTYSYPAVVKLEKGFHELRIYAIRGTATFLDASIQPL